MYQALYRKWRPRTFDDVVGQSHITDTLKQQVAGGRLSHAYLFTGTRGTGKTTCAKILSRAVNCQSPVNGNPCNQCPACLGIENGSILDVLELDAASNNGVDQVRALRDEAVYTPAAVRKRVYIVDEVHMLSTPAFNALLKILEEPPSHLMFILATTELHKVPATIRSRCQQFAFKRILPGQIAQRLEYVAGQEGIDLTPEGAALLARLADGGLRDALSLLDQCSGGGQQVDEQAVLDTLGLAGNLETARLMELAARHDTAAALETLSRLYAGGKDVGAVLGELSSLARDLLMRKTAPRGGSALLTGGYDETTMRGLGELLTAPRLLQMLNRLQDTAALLPRSNSRRTDAELCLIRLCDETLDDSAAGLSARIARLEEQADGRFGGGRRGGAAARPASAGARGGSSLDGGASAPAGGTGGGADPGRAGETACGGPACPAGRRRGRELLLARLRGGGQAKAALRGALSGEPGKDGGDLEKRGADPVGGQRIHQGDAQQAQHHGGAGTGRRAAVRRAGQSSLPNREALSGGPGHGAGLGSWTAGRPGRPAGVWGTV